MEDIVKVYSSTTIDNYIIEKESKEVVETLVNRQLSQGIANYIIDNMDKVPMTIESRTIIKNDSGEYVLKINIISDRELLRLKSIEEEYNQMRFNFKQS